MRARARAQSVHDMPGTHCGSGSEAMAGKLVTISYKPLQAPGTWALFGDMLARRGLVAITACSRACSGTTSPSELVVALQAITTRHGLVTRIVAQQVWRSPTAPPSRGVGWEPPHVPLRPRASPQAPLTPVHKLPRPKEMPLEPPAPAWP